MGALGAFSALMTALAWRLQRRGKNNQQHNMGHNPGHSFDPQRYMDRQDIDQMEARLTNALNEIRAAIGEMKDVLQRIEVNISRNPRSS